MWPVEYPKYPADWEPEKRPEEKPEKEEKIDPLTIWMLEE